MKHPYQFRLKNSSGYYYVTPAGSVGVAPGTDEALLTASVVDWNKLLLTWKRHNVYHGVFRKYAPDTVRFAKDGAKILRYIYNTQGRLEAPLTLEIMKLNKSTQAYDTLGDFEINFRPYRNYELYVDVALMEGGKSALLNAFDSTEFAILIGDPEASSEYRYLYMDGVLLHGKFNYNTINDAQTVMDSGANFSKTLPLVYINEEGSFAVGIQNSTLVPFIQWTGGNFDDAFCFKSIAEFDGKVSVRIPVTITNGSLTDTLTIKLKIEIRGEKPGVAALHNEYIWDYAFDVNPAGIAPGAVVDTIIEGSMAADFPFTNENYIIIMIQDWNVSGGGASPVNVHFPLDGSLGVVSVDYKYRQPATPCRSMTWWQLFTNLCSKVTGVFIPPVSGSGASSNYLTTDIGDPGDDVWGLNPTRTHFTCGDALRQLVGTDGPAIKISMKDMAATALHMACAGIGIENIGGTDNFVLEPLSHFYQSGVLIKNLGSRISGFEKSDYADYLGNSIKNGYPDQSYDEINGRYEFNAETLHKTSITREQNDVDYTVKPRTDCLGMEYVRANLANKKTTDNSGDNDAFIVQGSGGDITLPDITAPIYTLERNHTISAGIPNDMRPTVFNVFLSPKRNLLRMLPFLKSIYYGVPDTLLRWISSTKNTEFESANYYEFPSLTSVTESANLSVASTGGDLLFKPFVFEFEAEATLDLNTLMTANPYGVMGFTYKGVYLEGFVLEAGVKPGIKDTFRFKLLCSPNTVIPDWL